uniref:Uncharacterized protein n=1 Tax=Anopheles culicifacies TaxID=139723 RepID=A0A182M073_9DIPT
MPHDTIPASTNDPSSFWQASGDPPSPLHVSTPASPPAHMKPLRSLKNGPTPAKRSMPKQLPLSITGSVIFFITFAYTPFCSPHPLAMQRWPTNCSCNCGKHMGRIYPKLTSQLRSSLRSSQCRSPHTNCPLPTITSFSILHRMATSKDDESTKKPWYEL